MCCKGNGYIIKIKNVPNRNVPFGTLRTVKGEKMIKIENLTKSYVKGKKIIDDMNLEIKDGEIFGFLGPNGAGKTTTIKMITGILNPDEGDIFIDGHSIRKEPIKAKRNFGFVPDTPDMFLRLKGIEYLNFVADMYEIDSQTRKEKIESLAKQFEIYESLGSQLQTYSHGMRQKIVIVGVLLNNPKNWILDEPMTGLDPKSSFDLKEMMRKHTREGNSVFFSTHILEVAEKLCDRFAIINKGKIVFVGTYEQMQEQFKDKGSLEDLFLEITQGREEKEE